MPTSRTGNRALIKWDPFVVFPNIEVLKPPKMDGLFHGKPIFGSTPILGRIKQCKCMIILRDFPYNSALFGLEI